MEKNLELSPEESLKLIAETIEKTKTNVQTGSFYFLLWGWLVSIAGIAQFLLLEYTTIRAYIYVWPIMTVIGIISCIVYGFKVERHKTVQTHLDDVFMYLWIVLGVSFILVVFIALWLNVTVVPFVLLVAGIGTLASGLIIKFRPMVIGGILFFIFSVGVLFVPQSFEILISTAAIVTGYLVPGYILKNEEKNK